MKGDEELVFDFSCDYFCEGEGVLFCECGLCPYKWGSLV